MKIQEILQLTSSLTLNTEASLANPQDITFEKISELARASTKDMVLVSKPEQITEALEKGIQVIGYLKKLKSALPQNRKAVFLESPNFAKTLSEILPHFENESKISFAPSHTAIDPTARIGARVQIGPFSVIGAQAEIGDDVILGPHTVIEPYAKISAKSHLVSHSFVGHHCVVGERCLFHSHVVIGSDGYGFFTNEKGHHIKVPQIGNVVIDNDVELGAFVAIDRSTLGTTHIRQGTKMDNFCHVAHNCDIGEHSLAAAGFMAAGSSKVGAHFVAGGASHIGDHVTIAEKVILAGRSGVTANIAASGIYGGFPLQPIKDYLKNLNNVKQLTTMRKTLDLIVKHLGIDLEKPSSSKDQSAHSGNG